MLGKIVKNIICVINMSEEINLNNGEKGRDLTVEEKNILSKEYDSSNCDFITDFFKLMKTDYKNFIEIYNRKNIPNKPKNEKDLAKLIINFPKKLIGKISDEEIRKKMKYKSPLIGSLPRLLYLCFYYEDFNCPKEDFYIAYLFNEDLSKVFLTLELGSENKYTFQRLKQKFENIRELDKVKNKFKKEILEDNSLINNEINIDLKNFDDEISLKIDENKQKQDEKAKKYEDGSVLIKSYEIKNLPPEGELLDDFNNLIKIYKFILNEFKDNNKHVEEFEETKTTMTSYNSFYEYLWENEFYFDKKTVENYLLSLKVKPFVILTGNSGTGKTKLSQLFARYLNDKDNYKIIPVGANWTENRHILGYFNIIKNEPQYTPAYHLIKQSQKKKYPHFLILDEMNLSHVERYFADFLSAIESNENIPLYGKDELEIPDNLSIIGTVNIDETTYMFSPKVLDRANTIEFKICSAKDYMTQKLNKDTPNGDVEYLEDILNNQELRKMSIHELEKIFDEEFWDKFSDEILKFQNILKEAGFGFGFRVINEITRFMAAAYKYENKPEKWNENWKRYFDAQIKQKMLPKLHGSQKVIGETLDKLLESCKDYPTSQEKIIEMKNVLNKQRYVSFIN